jgi:hypothetical protein
MVDRIDEDGEDDDPRIAAVYRRMRMLVGVSALVMGLGFAFVFGVIVYRLMRTAPAPAGPAMQALNLPADARVASVTADGGRLYVTVSVGTATRVLVFDGASLAPVGRLDLVPGTQLAQPAQ